MVIECFENTLAQSAIEKTLQSPKTGYVSLARKTFSIPRKQAEKTRRALRGEEYVLLDVEESQVALSEALLRTGGWEYRKELSALKYARKLLIEAYARDGLDQQPHEQVIEIHHNGRWAPLLTVTIKDHKVVVIGPARWRFLNRTLNEAAGLPDELDDEVVTQDAWEKSVR